MNEAQTATRSPQNRGRSRNHADLVPYKDSGKKKVADIAFAKYIASSLQINDLDKTTLPETQAKFDEAINQKLVADAENKETTYNRALLDAEINTNVKKVKNFIENDLGRTLMYTLLPQYGVYKQDSGSYKVDAEMYSRLKGLATMEKPKAISAVWLAWRMLSGALKKH